jgi:hypothetical protein
MKKSGSFSRLGFEAGTFGIQNRSSAHPTVTFMIMQQPFVWGLVEKKMSLIRD